MVDVLDVSTAFVDVYVFVDVDVCVTIYVQLGIGWNEILTV